MPRPIGGACVVLVSLHHPPVRICVSVGGMMQPRSNSQKRKKGGESSWLSGLAGDVNALLHVNVNLLPTALLIFEQNQEFLLPQLAFTVHGFDVILMALRSS